MRVIQATGEVGDDRVLRVRLPDDAPVGPVDVVVVIEPIRARLTGAERRAAAQAGLGSLRNLAASTDHFLAECREEERGR